MPLRVSKDGENMRSGGGGGGGIVETGTTFDLRDKHEVG